MLRVSNDARASNAVARALVFLVERLEQSGLTDAQGPGTLPDRVRDGLRQLTARSRDGALLCRVTEGALVLEGAPIDQRGLSAEPYLAALLRRLLAMGAGSLTVREGAAPGELLTLASLLAQARPNPATTPTATSAVDSDGSSATSSDTPTAVRVFGYADEPPMELLRTWSVLVMPLPTARPVTPTANVAAGALTRLAAVRTDDAATSVVVTLIALLDDAQRRGDATVVDSIARGCMAQMNAVGSGGGRLALEGALRHLLRPALLTLDRKSVV